MNNAADGTHLPSAIETPLFYNFYIVLSGHLDIDIIHCQNSKQGPSFQIKPMSQKLQQLQQFASPSSNLIVIFYIFIPAEIWQPYLGQHMDCIFWIQDQTWASPGRRVWTEFYSWDRRHSHWSMVCLGSCYSHRGVQHNLPLSDHMADTQNYSDTDSGHTRLMGNKTVS